MKGKLAFGSQDARTNCLLASIWLQCLVNSQLAQWRIPLLYWVFVSFKFWADSFWQTIIVSRWYIKPPGPHLSENSATGKALYKSSSSSSAARRLWYSWQHTLNGSTVQKTFNLRIVQPSSGRSSSSAWVKQSPYTITSRAVQVYLSDR